MDGGFEGHVIDGFKIEIEEDDVSLQTTDIYNDTGLTKRSLVSTDVKREMLSKPNFDQHNNSNIPMLGGAFTHCHNTFIQADHTKVLQQICVDKRNKKVHQGVDLQLRRYPPLAEASMQDACCQIANYFSIKDIVDKVLVSKNSRVQLQDNRQSVSIKTDKTQPDVQSMSIKTDKTQPDVQSVSIKTDKTQPDVQSMSIKTDKTQPDVQSVSIKTDKTQPDVQSVSIKTDKTQPDVQSVSIKTDTEFWPAHFAGTYRAETKEQEEPLDLSMPKNSSLSETASLNSRDGFYGLQSLFDSPQQSDVALSTENTSPEHEQFCVLELPYSSSLMDFGQAQREEPMSRPRKEKKHVIHRPIPLYPHYKQPSYFCSLNLVPDFQERKPVKQDDRCWLIEPTIVCKDDWSRWNTATDRSRTVQLDTSYLEGGGHVSHDYPPIVFPSVQYWHSNYDPATGLLRYGDNPAQTRDFLTQTRDNPAHIRDNPAHIRDNPGHIRDNRTHIRDNPAHIKDNPAHIRDNPAHLRDNPAHIRDNQGHIRDNPAHIRDNLAHIRDNPGNIRGNPCRIRDNRAHIRDNPAHIKDNPAHVKDNPAHVKDNPAHIRDNPAHIRDNSDQTRNIPPDSWDVLLLAGAGFKNATLEPAVDADISSEACDFDYNLMKNSYLLHHTDSPRKTAVVSNTVSTSSRTNSTCTADVGNTSRTNSTCTADVGNTSRTNSTCTADVGNTSRINSTCTADVGNTSRTNSTCTADVGNTSRTNSTCTVDVGNTSRTNSTCTADVGNTSRTNSTCTADVGNTALSRQMASDDVLKLEEDGRSLPQRALTIKKNYTELQVPMGKKSSHSNTHADCGERDTLHVDRTRFITADLVRILELQHSKWLEDSNYQDETSTKTNSEMKGKRSRNKTEKQKSSFKFPDLGRLNSSHLKRQSPAPGPACADVNLLAGTTCSSSSVQTAVQTSHPHLAYFLEAGKSLCEDLNLGKLATKPDDESNHVDQWALSDQAGTIELKCVKSTQTTLHRSDRQKGPAHANKSRPGLEDERKFQCQICNSRCFSFLELLKHQCYTLIGQPALLHATDCFQKTGKNEECECAPCSLCLGVFNSKYRLFSHYKRGCFGKLHTLAQYEEKLRESKREKNKTPVVELIVPKPKRQKKARSRTGNTDKTSLNLPCSNIRVLEEEKSETCTNTRESSTFYCPLERLGSPRQLKFKSNTQWLELPNHLPSLKLPTHPPSLELPTHPPSLELPTHPPSLELPTHPPSLELPTHLPSLKLPIYPPSLELPTHLPSLELPTHLPSLELPTHPSLELPTHLPSLELPTHPPSLELPTHLPSLELPTHPPSLELPTHPSLELPTHLPSLELPNHPPSLELPTHLPSLELPTHPPSLELPTHQPSLKKLIHPSLSEEKVQLASGNVKNLLFSIKYEKSQENDGSTELKTEIGSLLQLNLKTETGSPLQSSLKTGSSLDASLKTQIGSFLSKPSSSDMPASSVLVVPWWDEASIKLECGQPGGSSRAHQIADIQALRQTGHVDPKVATRATSTLVCQTDLVTFNQKSENATHTQLKAVNVQYYTHDEKTLIAEVAGASASILNKDSKKRRDKECQAPQSDPHATSKENLGLPTEIYRKSGITNNLPHNFFLNTKHILKKEKRNARKMNSASDQQLFQEKFNCFVKSIEKNGDAILTVKRKLPAPIEPGGKKLVRQTCLQAPLSDDHSETGGKKRVRQTCLQAPLSDDHSETGGKKLVRQTCLQAPLSDDHSELGGKKRVRQTCLQAPLSDDHSELGGKKLVRQTCLQAPLSDDHSELGGKKRVRQTCLQAPLSDDHSELGGKKRVRQTCLQAPLSDDHSELGGKKRVGQTCLQALLSDDETDNRQVKQVLKAVAFGKTERINTEGEKERITYVLDENNKPVTLIEKL